MTLPVGAKLGPYEILAPIGTGGMGEVVKAKSKARMPDFLATLLQSVNRPVVLLDPLLEPYAFVLADALDKQFLAAPALEQLDQERYGVVIRQRRTSSTAPNAPPISVCSMSAMVMPTLRASTAKPA